MVAKSINYEIERSWERKRRKGSPFEKQYDCKRTPSLLPGEQGDSLLSRLDPPWGQVASSIGRGQSIFHEVKCISKLGIISKERLSAFNCCVSPPFVPRSNLLRPVVSLVQRYYSPHRPLCCCRSNVLHLRQRQR